MEGAPQQFMAGARRRVGFLDEPRLAVRIEIQALRLFERQRAGAAPSEHRDLMAGLIDRAVAVEALGQAPAPARRWR